ncbi:MAG: FAD-dependent oxidoreductase [Planctomycetota bacterium]|jgi:ribulose 1,5-bisphosphate synthetase/thiazole synthase
MNSNNARRDFLKTTIAIPAFLAASNLYAVNKVPKSEAAYSTSSYKQLYRTDVLVVGAGPAGIGAAIAAARHGAETMIIERHAFFGGVASFSLGMNINQMRPAKRPRSNVHEFLIKKLLAYGDSAVQLRGHSIRCNVEYLKVAVLDAFDEVGCKYLVHTRAVDAIMENDRVTGVVIATKKGLVTIKAKVVIDCTGDADVCYYSGAETLFDKNNSPMTLCLNVTNFDMEKVKESDFRSAFKKARKAGKYPLLPGSCLLQKFPSSNTLMVNHHGTRTYGPLDATDPGQLTIAECFSRRQALQMISACREFGGEILKNTELINTGPQIGIRESRRLKGVYVISEEDAVTGRKFDDTIAWRSGAIDVGGGVYDAKMKVHDVPYRAILPEKIDGLLAAGRCLSTTHIAHSAGKSMGNCMATGHAAGLAGAICAKKNIMPRELNVTELQKALRADAVDLDPAGRAQ